MSRMLHGSLTPINLESQENVAYSNLGFQFVKYWNRYIALIRLDGGWTYQSCLEPACTNLWEWRHERPQNLFIWSLSIRMDINSQLHHKERCFYNDNSHDETIRSVGISSHFYIPPFGETASCHCTVHPVKDLAYSSYRPTFMIALRRAPVWGTMHSLMALMLPFVLCALAMRTIEPHNSNPAQTAQNFNAARMIMSRVRSTPMGPQNTSSPIALNVRVLVGMSFKGFKGLKVDRWGGFEDWRKGHNGFENWFVHHWWAILKFVERKGWP